MHVTYDKTDKGREEIATRRYGLSSRLRPLLVMIDGKKHSGELLDKVGGLGLGAASLEELREAGYIQVLARPSAAVSDTPAGVPERAENVASERDRYLAVYQFYNETIKSMLGLRGFALQLKVEKASTLDELRQLRQAYLDAVLKARGNETAQSMRVRLDSLLGRDESRSNSLTESA